MDIKYYCLKRKPTGEQSGSVPEQVFFTVSGKESSFKLHFGEGSRTLFDLLDLDENGILRLSDEKSYSLSGFNNQQDFEWGALGYRTSLNEREKRRKQEESRVWRESHGYT